MKAAVCRQCAGRAEFFHAPAEVRKIPPDREVAVIYDHRFVVADQRLSLQGGVDGTQLMRLDRDNAASRSVAAQHGFEGGRLEMTARTNEDEVRHTGKHAYDVLDHGAAIDGDERLGIRVTGAGKAGPGPRHWYYDLHSLPPFASTFWRYFSESIARSSAISCCRSGRQTPRRAMSSRTRTLASNCSSMASIMDAEFARKIKPRSCTRIVAVLRMCLPGPARKARAGCEPSAMRIAGPLQTTSSGTIGAHSSGSVYAARYNRSNRAGRTMQGTPLAANSRSRSSYQRSR